jgi:hypothetical protein
MYIYYVSGDMIMKYLLICLLLVVAVGMCIAQGDYRCIPGEIYYTYSVPVGWNVIGIGCCGLVASDSANPARGIIAINHLPRASFLPAYTTPESYLENYMPQDFSGENRVTNMRILSYEDDLGLAQSMASYFGFMASGKSMRCSFEVNGIPAQGYFTVVTNELMGQGTTVNFLAGGYAPTDQFDMEAPKLLDILNSIKFDYNYRGICGLIGGGSKNDSK